MDIFNIKVTSFYLIITINTLLLLLLVILIIVAHKFLAKYFVIDECKIGIGNSSIKLKVNRTVKVTANRILVELETRTLNVSIDENNDVIVEVYNSWYEAFKHIRELLSQIGYINKDVNYLQNITFEFLNLVLRKHLTKWQAKYRRWYENELKKSENINLAPQQIQLKYPEYNLLINDLKTTNNYVSKYVEDLKGIIAL